MFFSRPIYRFPLSIVVAAVLICGCQTTQIPKSQDPSVLERDQAEQSLKSVAESLAGKELSDQDIDRLKRDVIFDQEARSAVTTISDSFTKPQEVKYCPVDGKRFAGHLTKCPEHHVPLKKVE